MHAFAVPLDSLTSSGDFAIRAAALGEAVDLDRLVAALDLHRADRHGIVCKVAARLEHLGGDE